MGSTRPQELQMLASDSKSFQKLSNVAEACRMDHWTTTAGVTDNWNFFGTSREKQLDANLILERVIF